MINLSKNHPFFICITVFIFLSLNINLPYPAFAQDVYYLPEPGTMVHVSQAFDSPVLKGIKVYPDNPLRFDFIMDVGSDFMSDRNHGPTQGRPLRMEAGKLIKYFLASLTVPEKDLWVNLSPYEKNRIIPHSFGLTQMGRDLLGEDYVLKQITASLIYPEDAIGKNFWKRIYEQAVIKYGTTNIPVNTFNKVWIVPEKAIVYENTKAGTAYVMESKLKVMLEQDYLALEKTQRPTRGHVQSRTSKNVSPSTLPSEVALNMKAPQGNPRTPNKDINALGSKIIREIVIPQLTKEVNDNKNFAKLRQVYNSLILATWYKQKIKDSLLEAVYADKNKVAGIGYEKGTGSLKARALSSSTPNDIEFIYQRYLQAFKKGVYNYIKETQDPVTRQNIPRKYFSGGIKWEITRAMVVTHQLDKNMKSLPNRLYEVEANLIMSEDEAIERAGIAVRRILLHDSSLRQTPLEIQNLRRFLIDCEEELTDLHYQEQAVFYYHKLDEAFHVLMEARPFAISSKEGKADLEGSMLAISQLEKCLLIVQDLYEKFKNENFLDARSYESCLMFFNLILDGLKSSLEIARRKLFSETTNVKEVIEAFHKLHSYVRIIDNSPQQPLIIKGDSMALICALHNLAYNAISALNGIKKKAEIVLTVSVDSGNLVLSVSDNGPGFDNPPVPGRPPALDWDPVTNRQRIFNLNVTSGAISKSTGLGTTEVYYVVKDHFGEITANNRLDDQNSIIGANFTIRIPLSIEAVDTAIIKNSKVIPQQKIDVKYGGIDLTNSKVLETKKDNKGINFKFDPILFQEWKNARGFSAAVTSVKLIKSVQEFVQNPT
ncbi:MAG: HAMP domain-containing histidine kinase [Candidatus Omnitrophica bacterium]|nr:HAMP domain-containing histidine kinase [Candidatus Omnitrophota bacterium]